MRTGVAGGRRGGGVSLGGRPLPDFTLPGSGPPGGRVDPFTGQYPGIPTGGTGGASLGNQLCGLLPEGWARTLCQLGLGYTGWGGGQTQPNPFTGTPSTGCTQPGFVRDPISQQCVPAKGNGVGDPTGAYVTPGEYSTGERGIRLPSLVDVPTFRCPKFANNKVGILWMDPRTDQVVCLPRGTSGRGFGLVRKNPPRRKPYISAAMAKHLDLHDKVTKKAKEFASKAGFRCVRKGSGR